MQHLPREQGAVRDQGTVRAGHAAGESGVQGLRLLRGQKGGRASFGWVVTNVTLGESFKHFP